jgi:hypothetical protein
MLLSQQLARLAARCFAGRSREDVAATCMTFPVPADELWSSLLTYEEVKLSPPWWMTLLLPRPIGTKGDKTRPGATLPCHYENGYLTKRILQVHPPRRLEFEVVTQDLGIEDCVRAHIGSYEIRPRGSGSELELVTRYYAKLHPRWLWRPFEQWLAHRFHRHLLGAMRHQLSQRQAREDEAA